MKGFIEVTAPNDDSFKLGVSIVNILLFMNNKIYHNECGDKQQLFVKESYEEIKELIKQAQ